MDQSVFFAVDSDRLHRFVPRDEIGDDVVSALQSDLAMTVGETVLPIAHWEHDRTGPLSVALNAAGELVVLVLGNAFTDQGELISAISSLEQWLAPMDMRDLGELSGNPDRFIDGLWELSPRSPLNLASLMRVLVINPGVEPEPEVARASLPFCRVEVLRVEALEAADGTVAIRRTRASLSTEASETDAVTLQLGNDPATAAAESTNDVLLLLEDDAAFEAESVFADTAPEAETAPEPEATAASEVIDLTIDGEPEAELTVDAVDIDLVDPPVAPAPEAVPNPVSNGSVPTAPVAGQVPTIIRGSSYVTAELPLHFDATASRIESICDELFAAGPHLVLVVDLDQADESPIETASIFRWDTIRGKRQLFDQHALDESRRRRTVHLFVEGSSQPNRVFYVGTGKLLTQTDHSGASGLWFKLDAPIPPRQLAVLQHGRLPGTAEQTGRPTFSFASAHPGPPVAPGEPAHAQTPNWVPNV